MFWSKLFGTDKPAKPLTDDVRLLVTIYAPEELAVTESLLRDAGIPYLVRERGAGHAVKIITGQSLFGNDIYVEADRLAEAEALLAPADPTEDETDETEDTEENGDGNP